MHRGPATMLLSLLLATASPAIAQPAPPGPPPAAAAPLDDTARKALVAQLSAELRNRYIFPETAEKAAAAITAAAAAGAYDQIADLPGFTARLTADVRAVAHDKHLQLFVVNAPRQPPPGAGPMPSGEAGIVRADRLAGGIGYIEVFGFPPPWAFKPVLDRAMAGLKGSRALIIDARRNGGGVPASVSYLVSYLVPAGKRIEINGIVSRKAGTTELTRIPFFSEPTPFSLAGVPTYVLTSAATFSGGEELAYDIQTLKLGTVVGEVTGGGANPVGGFPIGREVIVQIPVGRSESGVTKSNWEGTGVQPDLKVAAADAFAATLRRLGEPPVGTIEAASTTSVFAPRTVPLEASEAVLRRLIAGLAAPEPDYTLASEIAGPARATLANVHRRLQALGAPQEVRFRQPNPMGGDEFALVYPDRTLIVALLLDPAGKLMGFMGPNPAPRGER